MNWVLQLLVMMVVPATMMQAGHQGPLGQNFLLNCCKIDRFLCFYQGRVQVERGCIVCCCGLLRWGGKECVGKCVGE